MCMLLSMWIAEVHFCNHMVFYYILPKTETSEEYPDCLWQLSKSYSADSSFVQVLPIQQLYMQRTKMQCSRTKQLSATYIGKSFVSRQNSLLLSYKALPDLEFRVLWLLYSQGRSPRSVYQSWIYTKAHITCFMLACLIYILPLSTDSTSFLRHPVILYVGLSLSWYR